MSKLLKSFGEAENTGTFFLPKGQWKGFLLHYIGTNGAGLTGTRADAGNVVLNWNGKDVINMDVEVLGFLNNVYGGVHTFASAIGAGYQFDVFIPCGLFGDGANVYDIGDEDRVYFRLDWTTLGGVLASGNVQIYGLSGTGVMNYLYNIITRHVVAGGAGNLADNYQVPNVSQVILYDDATILTNGQITKDGEIYADAPKAVLQAQSDWVHSLETTIANLIVFEFVLSGDAREAQSNALGYNYQFSGAGILRQYMAFVEFLPSKAAVSTMKAEQRINSIAMAAINPAPKPSFIPNSDYR